MNSKQSIPDTHGGGCLEKKVMKTWIGQTRCYYFHMTIQCPPLSHHCFKKKDGNRKAVYKYCHLKKHEFCGVSTSLMPWDRCDLNFNATKITWHSANLQLLKPEYRLFPAKTWPFQMENQMLLVVVKPFGPSPRPSALILKFLISSVPIWLAMKDPKMLKPLSCTAD